MLLIQELCKTITYEEARQQLPTLQKRVFTCLQELTPDFIAFEFRQNDYIGYKFNQKELDGHTINTIHFLLKNQLDDSRLILTNSDLIATYQRIKELLFINQAKKQEIIKSKIMEDGSEGYFVDNDLPLINRQKVNKIISVGKWRTQYEIRISNDS